MAAAEILGLIALVIGLAVGAEMVGDRIGVPNFLFFVLAGLAVGPAGLGLVHHDVFGENLSVVVGLGVAIIIFHSGYGITREALAEAPREVFFLGTVGVAVTFLGASAVTYLVMNVGVGLALLIGALLVATGTTVIEPLLAAVPVDESLASTLEIEATITEVSAGILAITVFNAFAIGEPDTTEFAFVFASTLAAGVLVGLTAGAVVRFLFQQMKHAPKNAPKHASQLHLATAVIAFAVAELITQEAGVAAVATAGIVLGNADLPYQEHVATFNEDFTTFIIAFVFVVLASFVEPDWLATIGIEGLIVAVAVITVVRPLAVFLSTASSDLSVREKAFLGTASPRGIIPAGVATILAIEIQDANPTAAAYITGTVLLVILVSTALEGVLAGRIAERFGLLVDTTLVVGGGRLGLALAEQYAERGERVILVETDRDELELVRNEGFETYHGDGTDAAVLRRAKIGKATKVVAATDDDGTNAEIARLVRAEFDVDTVLARINRRENRGLFDDLDVELLTGWQLDLWALERLVDQSAPEWLHAMTRGGGVRTLPAPEGFEGTVADLDRTLPERAFVVALTRDDRTWIPDAVETLEATDRLTLIGQSAAVEEATDRLGPFSADPVEPPPSTDDSETSST